MLLPIDLFPKGQSCLLAYYDNQLDRKALDEEASLHSATFLSHNEIQPYDNHETLFLEQVIRCQIFMENDSIYS